MATDSSATPQGKQRLNAEGYEERDANAKWVFGIVGFLFVAGITVHLIILWMYGGLKRTAPPNDRWVGGRHAAQSVITQTSFPRLQVSPPEDLREFRAREDAELNGYGWINKTARVVRIPIERAMELALQRGFPTSSGTNGLKLSPSSYQLQQQRPTTAEKEIVK